MGRFISAFCPFDHVPAGSCGLYVINRALGGRAYGEDTTLVVAISPKHKKSLDFCVVLCIATISPLVFFLWVVFFFFVSLSDLLHVIGLFDFQ